MKLDVNYVISLMGLVFVFLGVFMRMGNLKKLYWKSPRSAYGYIPLGLVFILAGYYETFSKQPGVRYYAYLALFVILIGITVLVGARPPEFMKPRWVTWVEKYPKSTRKAMAEAAEVDDHWEKNVANEAAVDAWAKQLIRKQSKKR